MFQMPLRLKMNPLRSQAGNAIVMLLGLAGIAGVMTFEVYRRNQAALHRSDHIQLREVASLANLSIKQRVQNPATCTQMLAGQPLSKASNAGLNPALNLVTLNYVYDKDFPGNGVRSDSQLTHSLFASMVGIDLAPNPDFSTIIREGDVAVELDRYSGTLSIVYSNYNNSSKEKPRFTVNQTGSFGIPILVWLKRSNGTIHSCFGPNSEGALCNEMGGYFLEPGVSAKYPIADYRYSCRNSLFTWKSADIHPQNVGVTRTAGVRLAKDDCKTAWGYDWTAIQAQESHAPLPQHFITPLSTTTKIRDQFICSKFD